MSELVARARLTRAVAPAHRRPAHRRAEHPRLPADVADPLLRVLRAALLPLLLRLSAPGSPRRAGDARRADDRVRRVRRTSAARVVGDERRVLRRDERLLEAALRRRCTSRSSSTPVGPKDVASGETMWAVCRSLIYSVAYFLVIVLLGLVDSWWAILALPALLRHRLRLRRSGDRRRHVDAELAGLRPRPARDAPDVPLLGDLLPDLRVPAVPVDRREVLPLYHGIYAVRSLTTGTVAAFPARNVAYLLAMGLVGMYVASRRIDKLLLT